MNETQSARKVYHGSLMQKPRLLALYVFLSVGVCLSQTINDSSPQSTAVDCSDPMQAESTACSGTSAQRSSSGQGRDYLSPSVLTPVLRTSPGSNTDQYIEGPPPLNPSQTPHSIIPLRAETEFKQTGADSACP